MNFFKIGFWVVLILLVALLVVSYLGLWPFCGCEECPPSFAPDDVKSYSDKEAAEIRKLYLEGKFQEIAETYYEKDTMLITPWGELKEGQDGIKEFYETLWASGIQDIIYESKSIDVNGEMAAEYGTYTFVMTDENSVENKLTSAVFSFREHKVECPWPPGYLSFSKY